MTSDADMSGKGVGKIGSCFFCCERCKPKASRLCCDTCNPAEFSQFSLPLSTTLLKASHKKWKLKVTNDEMDTRDLKLFEALKEWQHGEFLLQGFSDVDDDFIGPHIIVVDSILEHIVQLAHTQRIPINSDSS